MRPGLVVVGLGFAALAVGGLVALYLIPIPGPAVTHTTTASWLAIPGSANSTEYTAPAGATGFSVRWSATVPVSVQIYTGNGCEPGTSGCADWRLVENRTATTGGSYFANCSATFPYRVVWSDPGPGSGSVEVDSATTDPGTASLSTVSQVLLGLGVGALGFVGAVLLFLGLFLRGGVYRRTGPPGTPSDPVARPPDH